MRQLRAPTRKYIKSIGALRAELDERVAKRADVIGSMIGLKLRNGRSTGQTGITYFVREKIPKDELSPRERVPVRLYTNDGPIVTDVVAWPKMMEQFSPTPIIITDGLHQGTLSCFAESPAGRFGVSCAHCLVGADGNPATPTTIAYYADEQMHWRTIGSTVYLAYSPGTGRPGNFGYLDCGLFDLRDDDLIARANAATAARPILDTHSLIGHRLIGMSTLSAPGADAPLREATVIGVEANALGELSDLVLKVEAPGTFQGDSGMVWLTEDGRAAAIHARGERRPAMQGSRTTTAMLAKRVSRSLDAELLLG